MTFSCLTKDEVRKKYEQAENKSQMLHILADLTCSTTREMEEFLGLSTTPSAHYGRPLDKKQALRMFKAGASDKEIADALGVRLYTVQKWRWSNKLFRTTKSYCDQDICALYEKGMSDVEIANSLHCGRTTIVRWRKQNGNLPPHIKRRRRRKKDEI